MRALAPHWGALLALALFLVAGLAVLDDYGVPWDQFANRVRATTAWAFLAGNEEAFFDAPFYVRVYGPSFEWALLFAERSLAVEGSRGIYLSHHLALHCFFLSGGLFAYLLARRLFRNRALALFAMALFLLHPRLYAYSFLNSKDIAFFAMFIIALFLTHRAFNRDRISAFALLGVGVGVLVNLRIMGVVLLAAIPTLRAFDFAFAQGWAERKRVILATSAFALAATLSFYALLPYLWAAPLERIVEWWSTLSEHPAQVDELFRGSRGRSVDFLEYIPVWFSITSPPFALLLGLIGAGAILVGAVRAPQASIRSGNPRFGLLLVGCIAATVAAVILLDANVYNGWRQLYFLWAAFALLAALGLQRLAAAFPRSRLRAAVYAAAGIAVAATALSMALIHPNQQVYFNALVDRVTPERLRTQYEMDYWNLAMRQALEWLADNPGVIPDNPTVTPPRFTDWLTVKNLERLPDAAQARIAENLSRVAVVPAQTWRDWWPSNRTLGRVQVYGNTLFTIESSLDVEEVYEATRGREPNTAGAFRVHHLDGAVTLVMEPCAPSFIERVGATLRVTPVDPGDLPPWREGKRDDHRGFAFAGYGAFFDGKCVASLPLPAYPVAEFSLVWDPEPMDLETARDAMRRARDEGRPLARAAYDVYLSDGELVYVNDGCDPMETEHVFYMDVAPERTADLPEDLRKRGYERFRFDFYRQGAFVGEACVAAFALPDYPVASVRTGQSAPEGGDAWRAEFSLNPEPHRSAYLSAMQREPLARGVFDVYLADGALVYAKDPCDWNDTGDRFFLHLAPERIEDLPEERRKWEFDNLDFRFFGRGGYFDGKCAAAVPLPDYAIASARTGQFGREGEMWSAEFAVGALTDRHSRVSENP